MSESKCRCGHQHCSPLESGLWEDRSSPQHKGHGPRPRMVSLEPDFSLWKVVPDIRVMSRILPWTVFWKGPERETLRYRETNTCSSCSTATCSHCQKASHFPQRWTLLFTLLPKCGHVLTSNYSISGRNVFSKEGTVGTQRFHFCCMQRPRQKSCRDKTSLTFQTLPRKNTNDSKAWGWRRGVGGKGNERRATTRKILCSWKWNFMMLGLPLTAQGLTQQALIKH